MRIAIQNVSKNFGTFKALHDVSLEIASGELVAILGPSGCGKTTLLRIIAGLESADEGVVLLNGEDATHVHVRDRHVGFMFQNYALFRHMSVFENVAFGLRMRPRASRLSETLLQHKVHDLLSLVQLDGLSKRYPSQVSGGQRQRIALARALAVDPKVLLLDEPFGALDAKVRKELRRWLRRLHDDLLVTTLFVTHDQEEALEVADRLVLINSGHIEQTGTPQQVWYLPASPFVCGFLGDVNVLQGYAHKGQMHIGTDRCGCHLDSPEHLQAENAKAIAYVRPYDLAVQRHGDPSHNGIVVRLERAGVLGLIARLDCVPLDVAAAGTSHPIEVEMTAQQYHEMNLMEGDTLVLMPRKAMVFCDINNTRLTPLMPQFIKRLFPSSTGID